MIVSQYSLTYKSTAPQIINTRKVQSCTKGSQIQGCWWCNLIISLIMWCFCCDMNLLGSLISSAFFPFSLDADQNRDTKRGRQLIFALKGGAMKQALSLSKRRNTQLLEESVKGSCNSSTAVSRNKKPFQLMWICKGTCKGRGRRRLFSWKQRR